MRWQSPTSIAILALCLLSVAPVGPGFAQRSGKGATAAPGRSVLVVSADTTGVILPYPGGFVADAAAASKEGVPAAYHPKGRSWQTADAVIYVNFSPRSAEGIAGVDAVIQRDTEAVRNSGNGYKAVVSGSGKTRSGISYKIVDFKGTGANAPQERFAYLNTPDNVTMLVLSARTSSGFRARVSSYTDWVKTAAYVAVKPN